LREAILTKPVSLREVLDHLEMTFPDTAVYLRRSTGRLYSVGDYELSAADALEQMDGEVLSAEDRELLDVVRHADESDVFVPLPDDFDIHEWDIMRRFVRQLADDEHRRELDRAVRGRGAFRRFKGAIRRVDLESDWYDYRADALARIAVEWLVGEGVEFIDDRGSTRRADEGP